MNGTEDEIFPIDDYYLCLQHGDPKEVRYVNVLSLHACNRRGIISFCLTIYNTYICLTLNLHSRRSFVGGHKHMGEPASFVIILQWLFERLGIRGDIKAFLSTIPFKAQYLE